MVKVLQYGEGNFLRTFVDVYFDTLNKNDGGMYEVNIVKPITFGTLERFEKQGNKYHMEGNAQEITLKPLKIKGLRNRHIGSNPPLIVK